MPYCLDVQVGHNEPDREMLCSMLSEYKRLGILPEVTVAERGMWEGIKTLRVHTTDTRTLERVIREYFSDYFHGDADDFVFISHETAIAARQDLHYLPDLNTHHGSEPFEL